MRVGSKRSLSKSDCNDRGDVRVSDSVTKVLKKVQQKMCA